METRVFRTHPIFYQEFYPQQLSWGRLWKQRILGPQASLDQQSAEHVGNTWEGLASLERKWCPGASRAQVWWISSRCWEVSSRAAQQPRGFQKACPIPNHCSFPGRESSGPDLQTKHVCFPSTTQWWGTASLWDFKRRKREGEKRGRGKSGENE